MEQDLIGIVFIGAKGCLRDIHLGLYVENAHNGSLTLGKTYRGKYHWSDPNYYYLVINDHGVSHYYLVSLFKRVDEIRIEKLNILLD